MKPQHKRGNGGMDVGDANNIYCIHWFVGETENRDGKGLVQDGSRAGITTHPSLHKLSAIPITLFSCSGLRTQD